MNVLQFCHIKLVAIIHVLFVVHLAHSLTGATFELVLNNKITPIPIPLSVTHSLSPDTVPSVCVDRRKLWLAHAQ